MPETTPFSEPSTLPFAFPPFDAIRHDHYRPAFDAGVAEQRAEVETIAAQDDEPTFENTIEALERSGATYKRMMRVWTNLCASIVFSNVGSSSCAAMVSTSARCSATPASKAGR